MAQEGYNEDDALLFVLFFGHQCNSTVTIVNALVAIISGEFKCAKTDSFYLSLSKACCEAKGVPFNKFRKDVGTGQMNRHSPSSSRVYDEHEVKKLRGIMRNLFEDATREIKGFKKKDTEQYLLCHFNLCTNLKKSLPRIGTVRSMHIVCLASLIGLLPLEFYVYVPMHMSGGTGSFLVDEMGWENQRHKFEEKNDNVKLITWTSKIMDEMNKNFGQEFTPNMLENACCKISRVNVAKDVHFMLPWIDCDNEVTQKYHHQLEFRIVGGNRREWELVCFDGVSRHIVVSKYNDSILHIEKNGKKSMNMDMLKAIYNCMQS